MRLGIFGGAGRMGRAVAAAAREIAGVELIGAVDLGTAEQRLDGCEVVVDFSLPAATEALLEQLNAAGLPALVSGVTGRSPAQSALLAAYAGVAPVLTAANFSLGVAILRRLVSQAARMAGPGWDVEILDLHHGRKADAPSGTALSLARAAAEGAGSSWPAALVSGRDGHTGAREAGVIGIGALRGGDVVGEHTVYFLGQGERVELTHRASDRAIFARGALRAAGWLAGRPPGRYGLDDVLGAGDPIP